MQGQSYHATPASLCRSRDNLLRDQLALRRLPARVETVRYPGSDRRDGRRCAPAGGGRRPAIRPPRRGRRPVVAGTQRALCALGRRASDLGPRDVCPAGHTLRTPRPPAVSAGAVHRRAGCFGGGMDVCAEPADLSRTKRRRHGTVRVAGRGHPPGPMAGASMGLGAGHRCTAGRAGGQNRL
jgi:hypothetical protein